MLHHILPRSRSHLEATVVFNDLDIHGHAVRHSLAGHFWFDVCLYLHGEQLIGVLPFLTCVDLLFL